MSKPDQLTKDFIFKVEDVVAAFVCRQDEWKVFTIFL